MSIGQEILQEIGLTPKPSAPTARPIPPFRRDPETLYELFLERAGIMEFDGGLSRREAERQARLYVYGPN